MQPLAELDKLIQEFEHEVKITKSVNGLSDTLLNRSQQQANQLVDMQQRLQTSIGAVDTSVEEMKMFSGEVTRQVHQWQENTEHQLRSGLNTLNSGQQAAEQDRKAFQTALSKTLDSRFEHIDERQRKFFIELADSLRVRLEDHRSELKQVINWEATELKANITNQLTDIKDELSAEIQRQHKWLVALSIIGGLTVILLCFVLYQLP